MKSSEFPLQNPEIQQPLPVLLHVQKCPRGNLDRNSKPKPEVDDFGFDLPAKPRHKKPVKDEFAEEDYGFESAPLPERKRPVKKKPPRVEPKRRPGQDEKLSHWMQKGKAISDSHKDDEEEKEKIGITLYTRLIGVALTIALPIACWYSFGHVLNATGSSSWPTAQATIIDSYVQEKTTRRRFRTRTSYEAIVEYEFKVDNQTFESDSLTYKSRSSSSPDLAMGYVAAYPPQTQHTVYYKSSDPSVSVLDPGADGTTYLMLLIPLGCLIGPWLAYRNGLALNYRINADIRAQRRY
ncbi:MAG: DUF3592 domain-containing protein [Planctomycetaceae bacterium]